jgi:tetratricopeptide (TPR) repeat protein
MQTGRAEISDFDSDDIARERLHAEIARANLLRMRGDYKGAVDQCLSVLKRIPEDGDTHTLLGDIYAEQGNLDEAIQWYEMALDLDPKSNADLSKLNQVRQRFKDREAASAIAQLDIPVERTNFVLIGIAVVAILLCLGIGSYMLGQRNTASRSSRLARNLPVTAPPQSDAEPTNEDSGTPVNDDPTPINSDRIIPQEDAALTQMISQRSSDGSHLISASEDPRSKIVTLAYVVQPDEDERKIGAELARTTLSQSSDAQLVVLRGIKSDRLGYVADVPRARWQESETDAWKQANPNVDAWISHLLTNEWVPANVGSAATPPPSNSATASATPAAGP